MRPIYMIPAIFAVITGCYASKGPPPKELISLRSQQQASNKEIERLRKEVVTLTGVVEDLRRRVRDMETAMKGQATQERLYAGTLEQKTEPVEANDSEGSKSADQPSTRQVENSSPTNHESAGYMPQEDAPPQKPVVLKLYGTPKKKYASAATRRISRFVPFKEPPPPAGLDTGTGARSPAEMYGKAMALFRKGKYAEAERQFEALWRRHPHSDLADNALFWRGECFYRLGKYRMALTMYRKVVDLYPDGNKAPDAMLKSALALARMGKKDMAKKKLHEVMNRYPDTESASRAQTVLRRNLL